MTINEAIRVNTILKGAPVLRDDPLIINTLDMNIAALKEVNRYRTHHPLSKIKLLQGETTE